MINNYWINQSYCYILIIPAFGIVSTTISAYSNKSVFGYIGMVKRPSLTNSYEKPLYMLGSSNALNTSKFYSKKVKDITMSNQQVNKKILFFMNNFFYNLRDYTRGIFASRRRLRYSPIFY